ncbi:LuxR C-terminal-related transcriptional regulator [Nocardioides sp. HM23]|uniref:LuxR C-terminal-related transcriptional regulator n=1 Tax=Nocardioides bizhenqiangii TaxID=3095076 RepID=UPI002ACA3166|nr:LuxR C-terminal-related transcriptional regulator [Nocardioides sp. HM23]MDZ5619750.1 LuxR C-terminal-related transcriptional regulator [Nocardioides sp. HM23]
MATTRSTASVRGALPAELTSFVGRRHELSETRRLLASSRILTLTGAGGVGKTRLALRMAAEVRRTFPDGVWFVELAALHDPQLVPHTVANTLELRQVSADPASDLAAYLEPRRLLVVLDNCEHLTDACAVLVSKLLAAAPDLRILATSRHVLGVEGEQILAVPPLSTPAAQVTAGDAAHYESVRLFLDRAAAVAPDFEVADGNRDAVVELCRRLDGIPLAIELAAVWLRTLSPVQILDRLEDRFRLLTSGRSAVPARHQALDAAVGWSYELCSPAEQLLWERLSVFSGGFDLEAAEEVCSGEGLPTADVLNLVASLVNKSIVIRIQATSHTTAWYQMLETIRQYGEERLAAGAMRDLRVSHRNHYRSLAEGFAAEGFGQHQADWYIRLRREQGNFRAALEFALEDPGEAAAVFDIAAPLWNFWFAGFLREGYRYLTRAIDVAREPTPARAHGLWAAAYLALIAGDLGRTGTMLAEASDLAERFDDDLLRARIAELRGHSVLYHGDLPAAIALLEDARARFRALDEPVGEFDTLVLLAAATFFLQDPRDGEFSQQALALTEQYGALSSKAYALWCVGIASWRAGEYRRAVDNLRECVRLFQPLNDLTGIGFGVQALSWCAASTSPDERAARLLGASHAVWRISGAKIDETSPYSQVEKGSQEAVAAAIGAAAFERAFADGASYSLDEAMSLAMGDDAGAEPPTSALSGRGGAEAPGGLTRREREVAELLAEGLSNKEIAARLVISQRTVETHVEHVLGKLGISSRAQVASWVAEHLSR